MIKRVESGSYTLIETKGQTKILSLERIGDFAWVNASDIGEILITTHRQHTHDYVLSTGRYQLYDVEDEPALTDLLHLELEVGRGQWQGYLLLTGLPDSQDTRKRIVPTKECITPSINDERR